MAKETKMPFKVYLRPEIGHLLEQEKAKTGVTMSETVEQVLDGYFHRNVMTKVEEVNKPLTEQIAKLSDDVAYLTSAVNALYRSNDFLVYLTQMGMIEGKVDSIGKKTYKPSAEMKRLAAKKAMKDYSKLRSNTLSREEYLLADEDEDDFVLEADEEPIDRESFNPEDLRRQNHVSNNNEDDEEDNSIVREDETGGKSGLKKFLSARGN